MSTPVAEAISPRGAGLAPLAMTRKSDAAYHSVRRSIVLGYFHAGEALPEQKVAQQLGCSQGTVREAFLKLEHDGLVVRQGYGGTIVSSISVEEAVEMAKMRIQIECAGVEKSAPNLDSDTFAALSLITDQMDEATAASNYYLCSELDRSFHLMLFRESGLTSLEPILIRCQLHMHRFTYHLADDFNSDADLGDIHRGLLRVLETGDPEQSSQAIREHIEAVLDRSAPELKASKKK